MTNGASGQSPKGLSFACGLPMGGGVRDFRSSRGEPEGLRAAVDRASSGPRRLAGVGVVALLCAAWLLAASSAEAQSEDQVMAAFLFNFARYVEWPENAFDRADMPVRICLLGSRELGEVVTSTVSGKTVGKRKVVVSLASDLGASSGCHIFFVGRGVESPNEEAVAALSGSGVFSVADREGFARAGGIANFLRVDNRIRFEINPNAAKRAGLKVSAKLLRLAKVVK